MNYRQHKKKWKHCKACDLFKGRTKVVLCRGKLPAPIIFVGEAPGISEDVIGKPFVGPAGKLLDAIIERSIDGQYDYAITNLVACIPLEDGTKIHEPPQKAIQACTKRLKELLILCKPSLIVAVGRLSKHYFEQRIIDLSFLSEKATVIVITHPAAILRMDISQQGLAIQRAIVTIDDALVDF